MRVAEREAGDEGEASLSREKWDLGFCGRDEDEQVALLQREHAHPPARPAPRGVRRHPILRQSIRGNRGDFLGYFAHTAESAALRRQADAGLRSEAPAQPVAPPQPPLPDVGPAPNLPEGPPPKLPEKPREWVPLFDGEGLTGWRVLPSKDFVTHGTSVLLLSNTSAE